MMRLRTMINELDTLVATRHWFCVWCQSHYREIL
ncbi:putative zinc ribbon protein [Salmonella enterica subsp. salamae serovar 42:r:-]